MKPYISVVIFTFPLYKLRNTGRRSFLFKYKLTADGFEIVSSNLDGYCLAEDDDGDITITHKLIFEAGTNTFWEVYFDNPTDNERALLDNVVKDLSFREGIPAPMLEHNECS